MARFNRIPGKGGLLDSGLAALAALSGGFLIYAMPDGLFSRIVVASRLPQFLAAAQPPLGMKARLAVIAIVALVIYAFVWSLMRALDGLGRKPAAAAPVFADAEEESLAPRLRRADAHPDAPSRRPLLAGRDLGEPEFEEEPLELEAEAAVAPEPDFTREPDFHAQAEQAFAPEPEPEPEPAPKPHVESFPAFLVPQQPEPEPAEEPEPVVHEEASAEPLAAFGEEEDEEEYEDSPEMESDDQSLARLMHRFESGLGRKQQALDAMPHARQPEPEADPEPEPVPQERVGHRLRSAISELNKISAPGR
jgi:hypothetical protein